MGIGAEPKRTQLVLSILGVVVSLFAAYMSVQAHRLATSAAETGKAGLDEQLQTSHNILANWPGVHAVLPKSLYSCRGDNQQRPYTFTSVFTYTMNLFNRGAVSARLLDASVRDEDGEGSFTLRIRIDDAERELPAELPPNREIHLDLVGSRMQSFESESAAKAAMEETQRRSFRPVVHLLFDNGDDINHPISSYVTYDPFRFDFERLCSTALTDAIAQDSALVAVLRSRGL